MMKLEELEKDREIEAQSTLPRMPHSLARTPPG